MKPFPVNFLWGTSQSGHTVEGGNFASDWWRWEQRPGHIADGSISKQCSGHFDRFREDFDLARDLGHKSILISLEWSRIEPEAGGFDSSGRHGALGARKIKTGA